MSANRRQHAFGRLDDAVGISITHIGGIFARERERMVAWICHGAQGRPTQDGSSQELRMPVSIAIVDAFAHAVFLGNPAAVCFPVQGVDGAWMQAVAAEMNQSETAFLCPAGAAWDLRWFTPTVEVDL